MKIGDKFIARYITGDGTEHIEGEFIVSKLTKSFAYLTMIKEGFYCQYNNWKLRRIPLREFKGRKEPMPDWDDNSFTCYHFQSGTPTTYEGVI